MPAQFRNLVFEGGGVKGIAYAGAMRVLEERGVLGGIRRVGGSSAGAIHALILALECTADEQEAILRASDFGTFMDSSFGVIRDVRRLATRFGWFRGDAFRTWVGALLRERTGSAGITFGELRERGGPELHLIGTNLSTGFAEVFSHERHAGMQVVDALRISMSIPLFFQAVRHGPREDVYVDGGMILNYPVKLFDRLRYIEGEDGEGAGRRTDYYDRENERFERMRPGRSPYVYNRQTLGFRLDTEDEIALFRYDEPPVGRPIRRFHHFARALLEGLMNQQEHVHLHSDDWQRTVYINTLDVRTTDFHLAPERQVALLEQGRSGAERYFAWFDDPDEVPVNRFGSVVGP